MCKQEVTQAGKHYGYYPKKNKSNSNSSYRKNSKSYKNSSYSNKKNSTKKSSNSYKGSSYKKSSKKSSKYVEWPDCDDYETEDDFLDDWDGNMPDDSDAMDYWDNW